MSQSKLSHFTDEELADEQKRRVAEKKAEEQRQLEAHQKFIEQNIDNLLMLVPAHGPTSCSDKDLGNHYRARCPRCALLYAKQTGCYYDIKVELSVTEVVSEDEAERRRNVW